MRWQQLFADLSAQLEQAEQELDRAQAASRARAETGAVRLADRLRGAVGSPLVIRCRGAGQVTGELADVGEDWLLLADEHETESLVSAAAVLSVAGLGRVTAPATASGAVRARLDLRWAVRALARNRSPVHLVLEDGTRLTGTLDRVGADFCELAEHPEDALRRPGSVRGVQAVPLAGIMLVRTLLPGRV